MESRVIRVGEPEEHDLAEADDRVRGGEGERRAVERARDGERRDEQGGHGDEDRDPDRALLRVDDTRQPRVADPRPPEHAEHEEARGDPVPLGIGRLSAVHCVIARTKTRS